jgi:hypothetical protein
VFSGDRSPFAAKSLLDNFFGLRAPATSSWPLGIVYASHLLQARQAVAAVGRERNSGQRGERNKEKKKAIIDRSLFLTSKSCWQFGFVLRTKIEVSLDHVLLPSTYNQKLISHFLFLSAFEECSRARLRKVENCGVFSLLVITHPARRSHGAPEQQSNSNDPSPLDRPGGSESQATT